MPMNYKEGSGDPCFWRAFLPLLREIFTERGMSAADIMSIPRGQIIKMRTSLTDHELCEEL